MSEFEFNGKKYIPVKSTTGPGDGCKKCAFYDDNVACYEVDSVSSGRAACFDTNHHYKEVKSD